MPDDLTRSVDEAISDKVQCSYKGIFQNIAARFKGGLIFSFLLMLVFFAMGAGVILMIVFFILKSL